MKWIALVFVALPTMLIFIYGIIKPKESFMFGRRWQFNNEVEPSECALDMHRLLCIIGLIVTLIATVGLILIQ